MRLEFSAAAEADLVDMASFIARANPARAITFVDEIEAVSIKLLDYPHAGAARADPRAGLRSIPYISYVISIAPLPMLSGSNVFCMGREILVASSRSASRSLRIPIVGGSLLSGQFRHIDLTLPLHEAQSFHAPHRSSGSQPAPLSPRCRQFARYYAD